VTFGNDNEIYQFFDRPKRRISLGQALLISQEKTRIDGFFVIPVKTGIQNPKEKPGFLLSQE